MNFLNPWYVLAALAALVPLVIHLLHRQRARIEVFPSLEFIRKMMRKRTRRFHLKQILLLIVRTLLILTVALALARPTLTRGRAVRGHLPTTAAVILDDSYSMMRRADSGPLFDLAKAKTGEILRQFDRSDEVYLFTASRPARDLSGVWATHEPERLRQRLGELACSNFATDMAGPLEEAMRVLARSANPNKEIHIVSDMQRFGWEGVEREPGQESGQKPRRESGRESDGVPERGPGDDTKSGKVLVVDLGAEDANACVADVGFRVPVGSDDLEMEVTFERFNSKDSQGRVAEVFLRGSLLGRSVFSPGEAARERETFRLPPFPGFAWGEVAMAEDNLGADDKRYFAIPSRRRTVGLAGETYYISRALSPEGRGNLALVDIGEGTLSRESLSGLDMLVMSNVTRLAQLEIDALSDYLAAGGSLLIFLGNKVDTGDYNRNLLPRLGTPSAAVKIEGAAIARSTAAGAATGEGAGGRGAGFFAIERFDKSHPVFSKFKPDQSPFGDAHFYTFMKVTAEGGRALARFSDGSPALVELADRAMLFTSSADVSWSDFVLTPQFLPVVHEAMLYLTSGSLPGQGYNVGEEIMVRGEGTGEAYLEGPSGRLRLFPEAIGGGTRYRIPPANQPGVYFLRGDAETLSVFAVNLDARESNLAKVEPREVGAKLGGFEIKWVTTPDDIGESVALLRRGRDLSRPLLWAGLALLLAETLLASTFLLRPSKAEDQDAFSNS